MPRGSICGFRATFHTQFKCFPPVGNIGAVWEERRGEERRGEDKEKKKEKEKEKEERRQGENSCSTSLVKAAIIDDLPVFPPFHLPRRLSRAPLTGSQRSGLEPTSSAARTTATSCWSSRFSRAARAMRQAWSRLATRYADEYVSVLMLICAVP